MPIPCASTSESVSVLPKFLEDFGHDILSFGLITCKQTFTDRNTNEGIMCPAVFSSVQFDLKTCLIKSSVNVPFNKCVNLKCEEKEVNGNNSFSDYSAVRCLLCNTIVGVIYLQSVAFVENVTIDTDNCELFDAPMIDEAAERRAPHRGIMDPSFDLDDLQPWIPRERERRLYMVMCYRNSAEKIIKKARKILKLRRCGRERRFRKNRRNFIFVSFILFSFLFFHCFTKF